MSGAGRKLFGRISMLAGCGLMLSVACAAQTSATNPQASGTKSAAPPTKAMPSVGQILDRYIEASGGRDAWLKLKTRVSKGTIEVPAMNLSGTVEIHEKAPDMMRVDVTIGGNTFVQSYDGKAAWSNDPQNGLRDLTGDQLAETQRDADFYHPLDMRRLYSKLAVTGTETIDEREAYVVEATTGAGAEPDKIYFDATSGFPIRIVSQRHTPDGVTTIQEDLSDYREVDGIKLPFSVKQTNSQSEFTITLSEVQHNVEMDDAEFAKPASQ